MALRVAVANGNWSNPATWNGGVLPSAGDIVASNGFTVAIDQNINVDLLTNTARSLVTATAAMTGYTTPSGIVTASSDGGVGNPAWAAFDRNYSLTPAWYSLYSTMPQWIAYEFPTSIAIDRYYLGVRGDGYDPKDWTFEGWNGTSWVVLHTVTNNLTGSYLSPVLGNTTPYIKYRVNVSAVRGSNIVIIIEAELYQYLGTSSAVAGGGFTLNGGVTVTLTNTTAGIIAGPTNCITYSASTGTSTINGIIRGSTTNSGFAGVLHSGAANLNINGDIQNGTLYSAGNNPGVRKTGTGTLSIVGNLYSIVDSNSNSPLYNTGTGTINITGNIYGHTPNTYTSANGYTPAFTNSQVCTINITGNIYGGNTPANNGASPGISNSAAATINIIGNVYSDKNNSGISTTAASYLNIIGTISSGFLNPSLNAYPAVSSTSNIAINIFSGPFISSPYGTFPYQCIRMHLIPTTTSYFEFRDETTNGALSPGAVAPATRMIAPAGVADAPIPANVRFGTVYANGSLTGTLKMPNPNSVAYGVQVDNTIGAAVLTPQSVWDFAIANLNTSGSIGERLKKVATVESTGAQLTSFEF